MKGLFKKITAALLVCALALTGAAVVATNGLRTLENVKVGGIRIVIDNKEFTCTDANGAVVEPMIYNGTTYIPVRAVSTAFGKAVHWDGDESTVYLGNMQGKLKEPTAKFEDIKNISEDKGGFEIKNNVFDNYDNFYNSAINNDDFWTNDTGAIYQGLLNKKYTTFKATLFVPKGSTWTTSQYVTIIGDGKVIYKSNEMNKTSEPVDIEVDISNINDFKVIFSHYNGIYMGNEGFYQ